MTLLQVLGLVCPVAALAGGIISGLVLAKANHNTKWGSKLGRWGIMGLLLLVFGMFGWIHSVTYDTKSIDHTSSYNTMEYSYGPMIKPNGHWGWGMRYGPKPGI